MMKKALYFLVFFLLVAAATYSQTAAKDSSYKNNVFVKGMEGKMSLIKIDSIYSIAVVHYGKKYHVVGKLKNGKEDGNWNLYDKVGKLRKSVFFMNGSVSQFSIYDKKGNLIKKSNFTVDF